MKRKIVPQSEEILSPPGMRFIHDQSLITLPDIFTFHNRQEECQPTSRMILSS